MSFKQNLPWLKGKFFLYLGCFWAVVGFLGLLIRLLVFFQIPEYGPAGLKYVGICTGFLVVGGFLMFPRLRFEKKQNEKKVEQLLTQYFYSPGVPEQAPKPPRTAWMEKFGFVGILYISVSVLDVPLGHLPFACLGMFIMLHLDIGFHELAHVIAARLQGGRPCNLEVGSGPRLIRKKFGQLMVRWHLIPSGGMVQVKRLYGSRWRSRLFFFAVAGPLADLLFFSVLLVFALILWPETGDHAFFYFLRSMVLPSCVFQGMILLVNATPLGYSIPGMRGSHFTDGFWIWNIHNLPERHRVFLVRNDIHQTLLSDLWDASEEVVEKAVYGLIPKDFKGQDRAEVMDSVSSLLLVNRKWLDLAERFVDDGLETDPGNQELKTTKGALLVELGKGREGLALLKDCYEHSEPCINRSLAAFYLALDAKKMGEPFADFLQEAQSISDLQGRILEEFPQS